MSFNVSPKDDLGPLGSGANGVMVIFLGSWFDRMHGLIQPNIGLHIQRLPINQRLETGFIASRQTEEQELQDQEKSDRIKKTFWREILIYKQVYE